MSDDGRRVSDAMIEAYMGAGVVAPSSEGYFAAQADVMNILRDLRDERAAHAETKSKLRGYQIAFDQDNESRDRAQKMLADRHLGKTHLQGALDEIECLKAERDELRARVAELERKIEQLHEASDAMIRHYDEKWKAVAMRDEGEG